MKDVAASVLAKLKNRAKQSGDKQSIQYIIQDCNSKDAHQIQKKNE